MRYIKAGGLMLGVTVLLQVMARNVPEFGQWYATTIYPVLVAVFGRLSGLFPFSVAEGLVYCGLFLLAGDGIRNWKSPKKIAGHLFLAGSLLALGYTLNCGINYYGVAFSYEYGLVIQPSSRQELLALCEFLTDKVNETVTDSSYSPEWNQEGVRAMQRLGGQYPRLAGYYPNPKGITASEVLSVQHLSGIYSPFTIEANYNRDMTGYNIPHTICHELSHLKGFMREDEANFIAYLACVGSDLPAYRYSGYLLGWIYATNQLAKEDFSGYYRLYERLDWQVKEDLLKNQEFWGRYEGKVSEAVTIVNDTYLKINDQSDGVKSYGRMVDLMLAYDRDQR